MKKYLIIFLSLFIIGVNEVKADSIDDECLENGTCFVMCNYVSTYYRYGDEITRNLTIYYNLDSNNIMINWQNSNKDIKVYTKGPDTIGRIFSTSGTNVYWGIDEQPNINNFTCPANGYLDTDTFNGDNELCFDNDGTTCKNEYSGFATTFGNVISQEKDYDILHQVEVYTDTMFDGIQEDISNGVYNEQIQNGTFGTEVIQNIVTESFETFKNGTLHGNEIPSFIVNSDAYQSLYEKVEEAFEQAAEEEREKAEEAHNNGNITDEEYENVLNNWNNIDTEEVVTNAQEALDQIKYESIQNIWEWEANTCDSILGSWDDPDDPAYYLNFAFNILKYAAIIILFVFTILDFAKAVASSDNDALKKALQKAIKRIIICIIIFFLPTLINFILNLLGIVDDPTCGIGVN